MGEEYYIVNLAKRQYVDASCFGESTKLSGILWGAHGVAVGLLLGRAGDVSAHPLAGAWAGDAVAAIGEYAEGGACGIVPWHLRCTYGARDYIEQHYEDISLEAMALFCGVLPHWVRETGWPPGHAMEGADLVYIGYTAVSRALPVLLDALTARLGEDWPLQWRAAATRCARMSSRFEPFAQYEMPLKAPRPTRARSDEDADRSCRDAQRLLVVNTRKREYLDASRLHAWMLYDDSLDTAITAALGWLIAYPSKGGLMTRRVSLRGPLDGAWAGDTVCIAEEKDDGHDARSAHVAARVRQRFADITDDLQTDVLVHGACDEHARAEHIRECVSVEPERLGTLGLLAIGHHRQATALCEILDGIFGWHWRQSIRGHARE